jgi:hypothetical protein
MMRAVITAIVLWLAMAVTVSLLAEVRADSTPNLNLNSGSSSNLDPKPNLKPCRAWVLHRERPICIR